MADTGKLLTDLQAAVKTLKAAEADYNEKSKAASFAANVLSDAKNKVRSLRADLNEALNAETGLTDGQDTGRATVSN